MLRGIPFSTAMQSMETVTPLSYPIFTHSVDIVLTADSFHRILLYRLNHLVVTQGFPDGGFFFRRTLGNDRVRVLRVVVAFSNGQTALALDLGDVEAGDFEAVGLHDGAVVGLVGFAELWGHGGLVVEVGQAAVRVSSNMYIFTNRIISKSAKKVFSDNGVPGGWLLYSVCFCWLERRNGTCERKTSLLRESMVQRNGRRKKRSREAWAPAVGILVPRCGFSLIIAAQILTVIFLFFD